MLRSAVSCNNTGDQIVSIIDSCKRKRKTMPWLVEQLVVALEIPALEARDLLRDAEERAQQLLKLL